VRFCESGTIASECTPGGQLRIASAEVERLKRAGLPQMPRPLPQEGGPAARNGRTSRRAHPLLLDLPSAQAIAAADQLVTLENEVKVLDLKREKEEKLDFFREREQQQAEEERVPEAGRRVPQGRS